MSKTAGNVIDQFVLADKYVADALSYYLIRGTGIRGDADFDENNLISRFNSDLANTIGNLLNRTLTMAQRYRNGSVRDVADPLKDKFKAVIDTVRSKAELTVEAFTFSGDRFELFLALINVSELAGRCNEFIEVTKPWDKRCSKEELDAVIYQLAEALRVLAILISPVLPKAAHGIFDQLNWKMELRGKEERFRLDDANWGGLPDGHVVGKPVPLFPRIEL